MGETVFLILVGAIIGGGLGIAGTVLGYRLNEHNSRRREEETEEEQARAIRTLLSVEIEQNIAWLRDFVSRVKQPDGADSGKETTPLDVARRLTQMPMPGWSHKMWESQLQWVKLALDDKQISQVHLFHKQLDRIGEIRTSLTRLETEERDDLWWEPTGASGVGLGVRAHAAPSRLEQSVTALVLEYERVATDLIRRGNPLATTPRSKGA